MSKLCLNVFVLVDICWLVWVFFCASSCCPTLLSYSSNMSLSLGRWTTHWISCSTRAVTIWMYNGSPSWSELFSLKGHKRRGYMISKHTFTLGNLRFCLNCYFRFIDGRTITKPLIWCLIPAINQCEFIEIKLPEIPEGAFAGGQSGQRCKDLLQDQLPMLLIAWEHLETDNNKRWLASTFIVL